MYFFVLYLFLRTWLFCRQHSRRDGRTDGRKSASKGTIWSAFRKNRDGLRPPVLWSKDVLFLEFWGFIFGAGFFFYSDCVYCTWTFLKMGFAIGTRLFSFSWICLDIKWMILRDSNLLSGSFHDIACFFLFFWHALPDGCGTECCWSSRKWPASSPF